MFLINLQNDMEKDKNLQQIKKKILKIYENYDVDVDEITEDEISRLIKYYSKNKKKLDADLKKSKLAGDKDE